MTEEDAGRKGGAGGKRDSTGTTAMAAAALASLGGEGQEGGAASSDPKVAGALATLQADLDPDDDGDDDEMEEDEEDGSAGVPGGLGGLGGGTIPPPVPYYGAVPPGLPSHVLPPHVQPPPHGMPAIMMGHPPPQVPPPVGGGRAGGGGSRRKSGGGAGGGGPRPLTKKEREPHLCQHDSNCNEPRTTKDRGGGLHVFCAKHKEEKQKAWREAAKRYRERRRQETVQAEGGGGRASAAVGDAGGAAAGERKGKNGAGNGAAGRAAGAGAAGKGKAGAGGGAKAATTPKGAGGGARGGGAKKQDAQQHIEPLAALEPLEHHPAGAAAGGPGGLLPPASHRPIALVKLSAAAGPGARPAVADNSSTPLSAWPQFWFQKEMMRYVEMGTREMIKRDFDNFSQGRPAFKGYAIQHTFSYELNAAPARYVEPSLGGTLGVELYPLEHFEWFGPLLDFLARQWWETGVIMMGEQIRKDEGVREKLKAEQFLSQANTVEKRKRVLLSLLGSVHLRSYHHQEEQPQSLGPRHGHLLMMLNIHGNGELVFTKPAPEGSGYMRKNEETGRMEEVVDDAEEALRMPLRSGDVYCYTGDYRYEYGAHVPLEAEYRCFIALRFWLPGREGYVRVRSPQDGKFLGWRRLHPELDRDRDDLWCTLDGKARGTLAPNYAALTKVLKEPDEPPLVFGLPNKGEAAAAGAGAGAGGDAAEGAAAAGGGGAAAAAEAEEEELLHKGEEDEEGAGAAAGAGGGAGEGEGAAKEEAEGEGQGATEV